MDYDWHEESAVRAVARDEAARILGKRNMLPIGDDFPEPGMAAHAATEVGQEDGLSCAHGIVYAFIASMAIWAFAAAVWRALK